MQKLRISDDLALPLDFITERIAFLARTGAGKSGGMRVLFEALLDAGQFVIFVDPKGDAWGIRAAGIGAGYPVLVMGGDHGDVPLESSAGKVVAEFLVKERVSTVLDVGDFGKAEMVRFVTDLASTLYRRNRDVVHVFLDEADMVAGEKFYDPKCLEAIQLIQNKGRHRGFGVTVATQRSAMINKTVLYASGTLVAMQTTSPKDIKTVRDWLEVVATSDVAKEIVSVLPTLRTREALVYSPQFLGGDPARITFKTFRTFDSMRTPKPGEARQQPKSLADIDLSTVQRDMAATIEKLKAEDPRELRKQIAELKRQITKPVVTEKSVETIKLVDKYSLKDGQLTRAEKILESVTTQTEKLQTVATEIREALGKVSTNGHKPPTPAVRVQRPAATARPPRPVRHVDDSDLSGPERRILDAIAWMESLGISEPNQVAVAFLADYTYGGGGFNNPRGALRTKGLVDYVGSNQIKLTNEGRARANFPGEVLTADELQRKVLDRLPGPERKILQVLLDAYPEPVSNEDCAERSGYTAGGGGFNNPKGRLRSLGLIDYPERNYAAAKSLLFLE